jgi:hypothetical protein
VKKWFQSLPFKFNLQRYNEVVQGMVIRRDCEVGLHKL